MFFLFKLYVDHRALHVLTHSFPTRRASDLIRRALTGGRVRMWSAGCSSGEEVYSLTMTLLGEDKANARRIAESDIAILASDLADHVIGTGRAATYHASSDDEMTVKLKQKWVVKNGANDAIWDTDRKSTHLKTRN